MSAAIWNKDVHTMAQLPVEILSLVMKNSSGEDLVSLSGVCTVFKDLVNHHQRQNGKIAFKVSHSNLDYREGSKVLRKSSRDYECLSVTNVILNEKNVTSVLMGRNDWKHLKMVCCYFETIAVMAQFISSLAESLETIDLDRCIVRSMPLAEDRLAVVLPKIQKISAQNFHLHYLCTTLKELELRGSFFDQAMELLATNRIEKLTLTYVDVSLNFSRQFREQEQLVTVKKITLRDSGKLSTIGVFAAATFQRYLALQTAIEEVHIDTIGKPQYSTSLERVFEASDFYRQREDQIRTEMSLIFTIFLSTILSDMRSVKKLTLGEQRPMRYSLFPRFPRNITITELRFEMLINNNTIKLVRELIRACPNLKKLSVVEFDQLMLEDCFFLMRKLETIEADMVRLEPTPSRVKLVALKNVKCKTLLVRSKGNMSKLTHTEQQNMIIGLLKLRAK